MALGAQLYQVQRMIRAARTAANNVVGASVRACAAYFAIKFLRGIISHGINKAAGLVIHSTTEELINLNPKITAIPVFSTDKDEYFIEIIKNSNILKQGIAIRITLQDLEEIETIVTALIKDVDIQKYNADLIIDAGQIPFPEDVIQTLAMVIKNFIKDLSLYHMSTFATTHEAF